MAQHLFCRFDHCFTRTRLALQGAKVLVESVRVVENAHKEEGSVANLGDVVAAFQQKSKVVVESLARQVTLQVVQHVAEGVFSQVELAQRVLVKGVESVGDQHELRAELGEQGGYDLVVEVEVVIVRDAQLVIAVVQRHIDVQPFSCRFEVAAPLTRVELGLVVLVDTDEHHFFT